MTTQNTLPTVICQYNIWRHETVLQDLGNEDQTNPTPSNPVWNHLCLTTYHKQQQAAVTLWSPQHNCHGPSTTTHTSSSTLAATK